MGAPVPRQRRALLARSAPNPQGEVQDLTGSVPRERTKSRCAFWVSQIQKKFGALAPRPSAKSILLQLVGSLPTLPPSRQQGQKTKKIPRFTQTRGFSTNTNYFAATLFTATLKVPTVWGWILKVLTMLKSFGAPLTASGGV